MDNTEKIICELHGTRHDSCVRSPPYKLFAFPSAITDEDGRNGYKLTRHTVNSSHGELVTKVNSSQRSRHRVKSSHGELVTGAQKRDSELVTRANALIRQSIHSCIVSIGASTF